MIAQQIESAGITGKPKNLEEQAIQLVGTDIYRKLIAGYTQKQWESPLASCRALSFVDCRFVSPMITIISIIGFKEFPKAATKGQTSPTSLVLNTCLFFARVDHFRLSRKCATRRYASGGLCI